MIFTLSVGHAAPKTAPVEPMVAAGQALAAAEFEKAFALVTTALKRTSNKPAEIAKLQVLRGEALLGLKRSDDAAAAFSAALKADPSVELDPTTASADAAFAMEKARRQIFSELSISVSGGAAKVRVDDAELGRAPLKMMVGGGKHKVEAIAEGGHTVTMQISVPVGKPLAVMVELPLAASLPPPPPANEPLSISVKKKPVARSSGSKLGFIPIALGAAAGGAGAFCLVQAKGRHDQLVDPLGPRLDTATEQQLASEGTNYQMIGFTMIGVGAAAVLAGGAMLIFSGSSSSGVSLIAAPSPNGVMVGLSGKFGEDW